jgi:hypothetical protein
VAEFYGTGVAAVFSANSELDVGASLLAEFYGCFD